MEFKYGTKVKIVKGFFSGTSGVIISCTSSYHFTRGFFHKETIVVPREYLVSFKRAVIENPNDSEKTEYFTEDFLEIV